MSRGFCFQIYGARLRIGTGWEKNTGWKVWPISRRLSLLPVTFPVDWVKLGSLGKIEKGPRLAGKKRRFGNKFRRR